MGDGNLEIGQLDAGAVLVSVEAPIGGRPFNLTARVPRALAAPSDLIPLFHRVADALLEVAAGESAAQGRPVACRRGCAACCRHLVPVSEVEARHLHALIERMPEEARAAVLGRLEAGLQRLREAGVSDRLERLDDLWGDELVVLIRDYFRAWVDCPFLQNESCMIHAERPAACREHLVISTPELCSRPDERAVERLPMPGFLVSRALRCFNAGTDFGRKQWRPLLTALGWASRQPPEAATATGPELLRRFFESLAGAGPGR